jgi:hypothetical protein
MSFVNQQTKEINCKIVYYGPGLGGKTTNVQHVYMKSQSESKGELVTLDTDNDRTLFFDFLPLEIGKIQGYNTRFHLYTVPGQVIYESSRKLILRGVDGIVFVADSQVERMEANIDSINSLKLNLEEQGYHVEKVPTIFQWNKRDLPNVAPINELSKKLNEFNWPEIEAQAVNGVGVFETLKTISKLVLMNVRGGLDRVGHNKYKE